MQFFPFPTQRLLRCFSAALFLATLSASAQNAPSPKPDTRPWMNRSLSPDQRADLVMKEMTLDEKMNFVHGTGWNGLRADAEIPKGSLGGAGYVQGVPRLGIPGINHGRLRGRHPPRRAGQPLRHAAALGSRRRLQLG